MDIVKKLRTLAAMECGEAGQYQYDHAPETHIATLAADEIERLRGVLSRIKNLPDTPSDELATATNMAYDALR